MKVVFIEIPEFGESNYAYLLIDEATKEAAVLDPATPSRVMAAAEKEGVTITKVLTTHHHHDHAGGNKEMAKLIPGLEVVGGKIDNVSACTLFVDDGQKIQFGQYIITCLLTPGHTKGSICYYAAELDPSGKLLNGAVFTGDTLFVGGAGRFFEGSAADMYPSLYEKVGALPGDTLVYAAHEYTLANYRFGLSVEPDNKQLQDRNRWAENQREQGLPTMPSTIAEEFATNPFMRCQLANAGAIMLTCGCAPNAGPIDILAAVRAKKNNFK